MPSQSDAELEAGVCEKDAGQQRGIPRAIFIEDVEAMCQKYTSQVLVTTLRELHTKYTYMQSSMATQKGSLKAKLPDIVSTKEAVTNMMSASADGEETIVTYQLSENIFSRARVPPTDKVSLWLGANVMLEYTLEEAIELLTKNETNATKMLEGLEEDLLFLRDQITTTEVNIARCHNYGVRQRQNEVTEAKAQPGPSAPAPAPEKATEAAKPQAKAAAEASKFLYTWKQQQDAVEVSVRVPKTEAALAKEDIKVEIRADALFVAHRETVLLEGTLAERCCPDGSTWKLTGRRVELSLKKGDDKQWPSLLSDA